MLDALLALPGVTMSFAGQALLRVTACALRLHETGLDLPVFVDTPERMHLPTVRWFELTCDIEATETLQGAAWLTTSGACVLEAGHMRISATRACLIGWELTGSDTGVRERLVLRLEAFTIGEV